jgi:diketogulonate reductase-like aldo/keto reductase
VHWPGASGVKSDSPRNAELRLETWQVRLRAAAAATAAAGAATAAAPRALAPAPSPAKQPPSPPPPRRGPRGRQALEQLHADGRARAIGVSNFEASHLRQLLAACRVRPAVNQIEVHPRRPARALRAACAAEGVAVIAYASLGCGQLLREPAVARVAAEVGRSPAQVLLRWGLQEGCAVIPKSVVPERIADFAPAKLLEGWELSGQQMAALGVLDDGTKFCWDPSGIV